MNEFINWTTLGGYGGALAMVMILTQFTKGLNFIKNVPTQIWSYILSLVVLIPAHIFTDGITANIFAQILFNGVIVSIAANGGYSGIQTLLGKTSDGQLLIDTSDPNKDTYRLDVGSIDGLAEKKTITLQIRNGKIYN